MGNIVTIIDDADQKEFEQIQSDYTDLIFKQKRFEDDLVGLIMNNQDYKNKEDELTEHQIKIEKLLQKRLKVELYKITKRGEEILDRRLIGHDYKVFRLFAQEVIVPKNDFKNLALFDSKFSKFKLHNKIFNEELEKVQSYESEDMTKLLEWVKLSMETCFYAYIGEINFLVASIVKNLDLHITRGTFVNSASGYDDTQTMDIKDFHKLLCGVIKTEISVKVTKGWFTDNVKITLKMSFRGRRFENLKNFLMLDYDEI